ncbi:MAG: hypothetical protein LBE79_07895 [Tannerella sp.]|jgi:hypothetical protein|nr:hypothetical protein [Tannerella sp.]
MNNNQCIVIFPIYKSLDEQEKKSVRQGIKMTNGFKHVFIAPESLVLDDSFEEFLPVEIVRFENCFFAGIKGYSTLMLSKHFYYRFQDYEFILIHQTDAYVFKPELDYWCNLDYDYIGAPWLEPEKKFKNKWRKVVFEAFLHLFFEKSEHCLQYLKVGNGGLSLRKTTAFIEVLEKAPKFLFSFYKKYLIHSLNEDMFWGIMANRIIKDFNVPNWKRALGFAMETKPATAFQLNDNQLPFGCHAMYKYEPEFWMQYIK